MPYLECTICGRKIESTREFKIKQTDSGPICDGCSIKIESTNDVRIRFDEADKPASATVLRPVIAPRGSIASARPASDSTLFTDDLGIALNQPSQNQHSPSTDPIRSSPKIGKQFGNYTIIEEVSRGSFGVVYRGKQKGLDRDVALKVMLAGSHASPEAIARFHREARAVARLKHPCIVPVYEIGLEDGHHFFAMEFIDGFPLSKLISKRQLSFSKALNLCEQIADAIHTAHQEGIIHRDIKPSNIIVDLKGRPHITDFGLAKQVNLDTQYTQSGTTLGTPAYMPPEQARGDLESINARSDVYALGAVLYEMLTGQAPYAGRSLVEIVVAVINEPVRAPRLLNPKIHRDIQTIVMKCLEKDPKNRYGSASEMGADIRRFLSGEAIRARPIGLAQSGWRYLLRRRYFIAAATVMIIALFYLVGQIRSLQSSYQEEKQKRQMEELITRQRLLEEKRAKELQEEEDRKFKWGTIWGFGQGALPANFKIPEGEENLFQGFMSTLVRQPVIIWDQGQTRFPSNVTQLTSPEGKEIFGSFRSTIRFKLDQEAASEELRIGFQSIEPPKIPYFLRIHQNKFQVLGPESLYSTLKLGSQKLRIEVKAEKSIPEMVPGEYTLEILREGMDLSFILYPPGKTDRLEIHITDFVNLSDWHMKRTVLDIRKKPKGCIFLSAKVEGKSLPKKLDDIAQTQNDFVRGEYGEAHKQLNLILKSEIAEANDEARTAHALKKVKAHLLLGMIEEIWNPLDLSANLLRNTPLEEEDPALASYKKALAALPGRQAIEAPRSIEGEIRFHILMRTIWLGNWTTAAADFTDLLKQIEDLKEFHDSLARFPKEGGGIREPYGWQIKNMLPILVPPQTVRSYTPREETYELGFQLLSQMGLSSQSPLLEDSAARIAKEYIMAKNSMPVRIRALMDLQRTYPNENFLNAFLELIDKRLDQNMNEEALNYLVFCNEQFLEGSSRNHITSKSIMLLEKCVNSGLFEVARNLMERVPSPILVGAFGRVLMAYVQDPTGNEMNDLPALLSLLEIASKIEPRQTDQLSELANGSGQLARALLMAGKPEMVKDVHEAFPTPLLGKYLAQAVERILESGSADAVEKALKILRYAGSTFPKGHPALSSAAYATAEFGLIQADGERNGYMNILNVQKAYPTDQLINLIAAVFKSLLDEREGDAALEYFKSARVVFHDVETRNRLRGFCADALGLLSHSTDPKQKLESISTAIRKALQDDPIGTQDWQVDQADILLARDYNQDAIAEYKRLMEQEKLNPHARARLALRLGTLRFIRDPASAMEFWNAMIYALPEEAEQAGKYIIGDCSYEELQAFKKELKPPLIFDRNEWDLIHILGKQNRGESLEKDLHAAKEMAAKTQSWTFSALIKLRPEQKKPREQDK